MDDFRIYAWMSRLPWPRSFRGKILAVVTAATFVPALCLIVAILLDGRAIGESRSLIAAVFLGSVIASAVSLPVISGLLVPVSRVAAALRLYLEQRTLPQLPQRFDDLPGRLMRDTGYAIARLDERLRELEVIATTDPLTGVYNRRAGELALSESLARCDRGLAPFMLLLLDVDQFKRINDQYGHDVGDHSLMSLVDWLRASVRGTDWIARWGGDEFVVGIVARSEEAPSIADRLRRDVDELRVNLADGTAVPISISAGIAVVSGKETTAGLFRRADEALYRAKAGGGGRVAIWSEGEGGVSARLIAPALSALVFLCAPSQLAAAPTAVFPVELVNTSLEPTRADERDRLAALERNLKGELARHDYVAVDLAPIATRLELLRSVRGCNGCERDLALEVGADYTAVGWVQKVSNLILNLNLELREAASGRLVAAGSVDLRGNTDESWDRAATYLVEHRLFGSGGRDAR